MNNVLHTDYCPQNVLFSLHKAIMQDISNECEIYQVSNKTFKCFM